MRLISAIRTILAAGVSGIFLGYLMCLKCEDKGYTKEEAYEPLSPTIRTKKKNVNGATRWSAPRLVMFKKYILRVTCDCKYGQRYYEKRYKEVTYE